MDKLLEYRDSIFETVPVDSNGNIAYPEESFFLYVSGLLSNSGILDDVEYCAHRDTSKGTRIDGYSWNSLEKTICGIIVNFKNTADEVETITNTQIIEIGKRMTRFFEQAGTKTIGIV
jgi:phosphosulfolactate phosphohydrolase-like enzyme